MPVSSERYFISIANGQNGTPVSEIKIHCHFVHLPFSNFSYYTIMFQESQYFESGVIYKLAVVIISLALASNHNSLVPSKVLTGFSGSNKKLRIFP